MPNSETLTVDGVNLKTLAKNVETLAATLRTPPVRNENVPIPSRHGRIRTRKVFDENVLAWPMWVIGCNDDGSIPAGSTERATFYRNLDALTRLFGKRTGTLDIRHTLPDGSVRQAFGEVLEEIDFSTFGDPPTGKFSVAMRIPDAFWRDLNAVQSAPAIARGATVVLPELSGGSAPSMEAVITIPGPGTNVRITDVVSGTWFQINRQLAAGETATIDLGTWAASVGAASIIPQITYGGGSSRFLELTPDPVTGNVSVRLDANADWAGQAVTFSGRRRYLVG